MINLKARLILVAVWASCCSKIQCDHFSNRALLDECRRVCGEARSRDKADVSQSGKPTCMVECLLKAKENVTTTTRPLTSSTREIFLNLTTAASTPSAREVHNCPRDYGPGPREVLPGEVSGVTITAQETNENSHQWVAKINWTEPKDANISLNWRGYLVVWTSQSDAIDIGEPQPVRCKLVPKTQTHLDISQADGWTYPESIFVAVIALPSKRDSFQMNEFNPRIAGWSAPDRIAPVKIHSKGRKPFRIQSPEGIAIVVVAGIITGLAIMWLVNICIIKRKTFTGYHVEFTCTGEKKAEKKADELKDQLIV